LILKKKIDFKFEVRNENKNIDTMSSTEMPIVQPKQEQEEIEVVEITILGKLYYMVNNGPDRGQLYDSDTGDEFGFYDEETKTIERKLRICEVGGCNTEVGWWNKQQIGYLCVGCHYKRFSGK